MVRKLTAPDSLMSGDHSEVVPLLPIPNRTVKHLSADDSADCPCESRSLPDFPKEEPDSKESGFLLCVEFVVEYGWLAVWEYWL